MNSITIFLLRGGRAVQDVVSSPYNPWQKLFCYRISCFVIEMFASNEEFTSTRHQSILTCQTGRFLCCFEEAGNSFRNPFRPVGLNLIFIYFQLYLCGILKVEQCHFKSPILLLFFVISHMLPSPNCRPPCRRCSVNIDTVPVPKNL